MDRKKLVAGLRVDPDVLRAFSDRVAIAANAIREANVGDKAKTAADGLSGSTTQWAVHLVGAHIAQLAENIATNINTMGTAVRGAGDKYEVTDNDLSNSFKKIF